MVESSWFQNTKGARTFNFWSSKCKKISNFFENGKIQLIADVLRQLGGVYCQRWKSYFVYFCFFLLELLNIEDGSFIPFPTILYTSQEPNARKQNERPRIKCCDEFIRNIIQTYINRSPMCAGMLYGKGSIFSNFFHVSTWAKKQI